MPIRRVQEAGSEDGRAQGGKGRRKEQLDKELEGRQTAAVFLT